MLEVRKQLVGIVGVEAAKLTEATEAQARRVIRILIDPAFAVVSGHCHLGGVDILAEEEAVRLGRRMIVFPPRFRGWEAYKERNLQIARCADVVYCITLRELPASYRGMRFDCCYHCGTDEHVKSGGCWTVKQAKEMGKKGEVIVL